LKILATLFGAPEQPLPYGGRKITRLTSQDVAAST
jgi:hypothetical protein